MVLFTILDDIASMKVECIWLGMSRDKSGWRLRWDYSIFFHFFLSIACQPFIPLIDQHEQAALDKYAAIHQNKLVDSLISEATYELVNTAINSSPEKVMAKGKDKR